MVPRAAPLELRAVPRVKSIFADQHPSVPATVPSTTGLDASQSNAQPTVLCRCIDVFVYFQSILQVVEVKPKPIKLGPRSVASSMQAEEESWAVYDTIDVAKCTYSVGDFVYVRRDAESGPSIHRIDSISIKDGTTITLSG